MSWVIVYGVIAALMFGCGVFGMCVGRLDAGSKLIIYGFILAAFALVFNDFRKGK